MSGSGNRIDSTGLGVSASSLQAGGVSVGTYDLRNKTNVLNNTNNDGQQVFTFNLAGGGTVAATVTAATGGITGRQRGDAAQLRAQLFGNLGVHQFHHRHSHVQQAGGFFDDHRGRVRHGPGGHQRRGDGGGDGGQ